MVATISHNRARGAHDVQLEAGLFRDMEKLGVLDIAIDSLLLDTVEVDRLLNEIRAVDVLPAEKFSEAWIPSSVKSVTRDILKSEQNVSTSNEGTTAITAEAREAAIRYNEALREAKSARDRAVAQKEAQLYNVTLVFSGYDAEVVKRALGAQPAYTILEWCRAKVQAEDS